MEKEKTRKKIIDLKESTFKALSFQAVEAGKPLKNYIESSLDELAAKDVKKKKK